MEDWLFKEDKYEPEKDKEGFLDKSILGVIMLLSKIQRGSRSEGKSMIYKVHPAVKLAGTVMLVLLLSLTQTFQYIGLIGCILLWVIAFFPLSDLKKILAVCAAVPLFTLIMFIPSILLGNGINSVKIILKIAVSIMAVNILSYSSRWAEITKALKVFRIPDIFIWVMEITIRYIFLLGEFALEMLYALKLRSVGKNRSKYSSMSKVVGNLFIKSKEVGDEVFSAMECRGFTGEYERKMEWKPTRADAIYITTAVLLLLLFFIVR